MMTYLIYNSGAKHFKNHVSICIFISSKDHRTVICVEGIIKKIKGTCERQCILSVNSYIVVAAFVHSSYKEKKKTINLKVTWFGEPTLAWL